MLNWQVTHLIWETLPRDMAKFALQLTKNQSKFNK